MISQIVKSEKELIKLIKNELKSYELSNNQHGSDSEEIKSTIDSWLKQNPIEKYPVFTLIKFDWRYRGFSYKLYDMVYIINKESAVSILESINNA